MLTYEVKITVEEKIELEWLSWMKTVHVPEVIACGLVRSFNILKPRDEPQVYCFQYHFENEEAFQEYEEKHAEALREDVKKNYPEGFQAERRIYYWI